MKRNWPYYIVALCLALLCVLLFRYPGRVFPSGDFSEVYRHYCDREDLCVEFFKDFRINDSTTVDVTTITAHDSASWESLLHEMNVKEKTIKNQTNAVRNGEKAITEYYCADNNPGERVSVKKCSDFDFVIFSFNERVLYFFAITSVEQGRIIQTHKIKEILINNTI